MAEQRQTDQQRADREATLAKFCARHPAKRPTRIDLGLLEKARMTAIKRRIGLYEYLDSILRQPIEADYSELFGNK